MRHLWMLAMLAVGCGDNGSQPDAFVDTCAPISGELVISGLGADGVYPLTSATYEFQLPMPEGGSISTLRLVGEGGRVELRSFMGVYGDATGSVVFTTASGTVPLMTINVTQSFDAECTRPYLSGTFDAMAGTAAMVSGTFHATATNTATP